MGYGDDLLVTALAAIEKKEISGATDCNRKY